MSPGESRRDYLDYLGDVEENMELAIRFAEGTDPDGFAGDVKTAYAVVRALEIVGEATKNVPPEVRERHPGVPWRRMTGMRDRLIHGYPRVDLAIVWETATRLLPELLPEVSRVLEHEENRGKEVDRRPRKADPAGDAADLSPEEEPRPEAPDDA